MAMRILLVEDEPMISVLLEEILSDAGHDVVATAGSIGEAQALIDGWYDCALLDCNMNGKPITPVATALRERGVPMVFVTGYDRGGLPPGFEEAEMVGKPFEFKQLVRALQNAT